MAMNKRTSQAASLLAGVRAKNGNVAHSSNDLTAPLCDVALKKTCAARAEVKADGKGMLVFTMSTASVDRDGDRIDQNWEVKGSIPLLYEHLWDAPPIGRVKNLRTDGKSTRFEAEFVPADVYPFAGMVEQLYRRGFLNAVSPGFIVKAKKTLTAEERKASGLGPMGEWITAAELLEVSAVNIPANSEALIASDGKSMAPIYRAAGSKVDLGELVTKGLNRAAVDQWLKGEAMEIEGVFATDCNVVQITKADEPPAPPPAEPPPAEAEAPAAEGEHAECIAILDECIAMLQGTEPVQASDLLAKLQAAKADLEGGAAPEGEAPPPPPPAEAGKSLTDERIDKLIAAVERLVATKSAAPEADEIEAELPDNEEELEKYLSDADELETLTASILGSGHGEES